MIQLSYQPAFDPYHTVYRMLRIREAILREKPLHEDHLRILDFYLLFPFRIAGIRLQQAHRKFRKLATAYADARPYGELPEDRVLFERMNVLQTAALNTLATKEFIDGRSHESGTIAATANKLPDELMKRVDTENGKQSDLMAFLTVLAQDYELLGADGLKDRTGLMEYRYDAI